MKRLLLSLLFIFSTTAFADRAGGGGAKNEADFKAHLYKITDELLVKRKMTLVGDNETNIDLKLFLAAAKMAKVDVIKTAPRWNGKQKDAIYDGELDVIKVGPSFFENPLDSEMYPKEFGKPRKDILQDIIAAHEIIRFMHAHELSESNDDDYYLSIRMVAEVIGPRNDAFFDAAKTIPRLAYEVSSDKENTYYAKTGMTDVVRTRDLRGPMVMASYFLSGGERAKVRALKICNSLHGNDFGVRRYEMKPLQKGDVSNEFVAFRPHLCSKGESVADNTSVGVQTTVDTSPGVSGNSTVMLDKYYVFTILECTNVKSEMIIKNDLYEICE